VPHPDKTATNDVKVSNKLGDLIEKYEPESAPTAIATEENPIPD